MVASINDQLIAARADMIKNLENQQNALQVTRSNLTCQNSFLNNMISDVSVEELLYV